MYTHTHPAQSVSITYMCMISGLTTWYWISNWGAHPWGKILLLSSPWLPIILCLCVRPRKISPFPGSILTGVVL